MVSTTWSSIRPLTKHTPRWPSRSLQARGQRSHWMRPSSSTCQYSVGTVSGSARLISAVISTVHDRDAAPRTGGPKVTNRPPGAPRWVGAGARNRHRRHRDQGCAGRHRDRRAPRGSATGPHPGSPDAGSRGGGRRGPPPPLLPRRPGGVHLPRRGGARGGAHRRERRSLLDRGRRRGAPHRNRGPAGDGAQRRRCRWACRDRARCGPRQHRNRAGRHPRHRHRHGAVRGRRAGPQHRAGPRGDPRARGGAAGLQRGAGRRGG